MGANAITATGSIRRAGNPWWAVVPIATGLVGIAVVLLIVPVGEMCGASLPGTIGCFAPELSAWAIGAIIALLLTGALVVLVGWRSPRRRMVAVIVGLVLHCAITAAALIARFNAESLANQFS